MGLFNRRAKEIELMTYREEVIRRRVAEAKRFNDISNPLFNAEVYDFETLPESLQHDIDAEAKDLLRQAKKKK